ncbi:hypothetical protein CWI36_0072p0060 [Hamiltosporidium magnivora]|uniref:Uncharacterized protein n=1 Tax=Hamiltosporidium magnivora TaxID=148818 RepID=A0A4Q9LNC4_9MICR|nr:hypothetical protein CWI36_0072p0060 [Hamiltosporidium magnivora]
MKQISHQKQENIKEMPILLLFLTSTMAQHCDCNIYIPECYNICNMYGGRYLYNPNVYTKGKPPNIAIPVYNGYYRTPSISILKPQTNTGITYNNNTPINNRNIRGVTYSNVSSNNNPINNQNVRGVTIVPSNTNNNTPINNRNLRGITIIPSNGSNNTPPSQRNATTNNNTSTLDNNTTKNRNIIRIYNNKIEDTKKSTKINDSINNIDSTKSTNTTNNTINNTNSTQTSLVTISKIPYSTNIEEICRLLSWLNGYQQSSENKITVLNDSIEKIKIKIFEIYDTDNIRCKISNEGTYNIFSDSIKYKSVTSEIVGNRGVNSNVSNNGTLCDSTSYLNKYGISTPNTTTVCNNGTLCDSTLYLKEYSINTPLDSYKSISYSRYSYVTTITPFKYTYITEYPNTSYITEKNKGVNNIHGNKTPLVKWKKKGHRNNTPLARRKMKDHRNKTLEITEYPKTSYITTTMCFTTTPYKTIYVLRDNKGNISSLKKKRVGSKSTVFNTLCSTPTVDKTLYNTSNDIETETSNNTVYSTSKDMEPETSNKAHYTPFDNTTTVIISETVDNTLYTTATINNTITDVKSETINNTLYTTVTINNTVTNTMKETLNNTLYTTVTDTKKETINNTLYTTVTDTKKETINNTLYTTVTINNTLIDTKKQIVNNTLYTTVTNRVKETVNNTLYKTVTAIKPLTVTNTLYTTVTNTIKQTVNNIIPSTVTITDIKNNLIPTTITKPDINNKTRNKNTITTLVTYYTTTTIEYDIYKETTSFDTESEITPLSIGVSSSKLKPLSIGVSSSKSTTLSIDISSGKLTPLKLVDSSSKLKPLSIGVSSSILTPLKSRDTSNVLTPLTSSTPTPITTDNLTSVSYSTTTTSTITPFTFTLPLVTDNNKTIMIEELKGLFTQLIDLEKIRSDTDISSMTPIILFKSHSTNKNLTKEIKTCVLTSEINSDQNSLNNQSAKTDTFTINNDSIINNFKLFKDIIGIL